MKAVCALLVLVPLALPAQAEDASASAVPSGPASSPAFAVPAESAPVSPAAAAAPNESPPAAASAPGAPKKPVPAAPRRAQERRAAPKKNASATKRVAPKKAAAAEETRNPVLEAINLVASTQQDEIRAADRKVADADWWVDTLERDWIVRRPFGPGLFDSTHWFYVSYKVNGRILMSWFVDLEKRTVAPIAPPEHQSAR